MCDNCRRREDADRLMWAAIRRGLLAVVKAIEVRYAEKPETTQERRAA